MSPKKNEILTGLPCESEEASDSLGLSVSRRDFFKTVSIAGIATGVISPGATRAQEGVRAIGPNSVPVELTINGQSHKLKIEPRVTLLDAARNQLDITGAKRVCDRGSCGACTMMVDGRAGVLMFHACDRGTGQGDSNCRGACECRWVAPCSAGFL